MVSRTEEREFSGPPESSEIAEERATDDAREPSSLERERGQAGGSGVDRVPLERTTLLMVRHGESLANSEARFTRTEDEPLTELGVEQARATGERLAARYRPSALYCSPYHRAHHTAREIGRHFALEPKIVEQLYEQSFGELHGRPYADYFPRAAQIAAAERWEMTAPGGESLRQVAERVGPAVRELSTLHLGETIVVVSHGGVMAALRGWVSGDYRSPPQATENAWGYRLVVRGNGRHFEAPQPLL